jgi:hypothetical protein
VVFQAAAWQRKRLNCTLESTWSFVHDLIAAWQLLVRQVRHYSPAIRDRDARTVNHNKGCICLLIFHRGLLYAGSTEPTVDTLANSIVLNVS